MRASKILPRPPQLSRVRQLLAAAAQARVLVLGDVMLDHFLWGKVERISPEAPVPVVEFQRESFVPGGAGNVARNLADLNASTELFGAVGDDPQAGQLKKILKRAGIGCAGLLTCPERVTSIKTRIIAHRQQLVRVDRESRVYVGEETTARLLAALESRLQDGDALILGDYAKGVVTQHLLDQARNLCRRRGAWLSVDPKPAHHLNLSRVSLLTPNRKEAFELAAISDASPDSSRGAPPLKDAGLMRVAKQLLTDLQPALLLITLGDQGMLLCQRGQPPIHIATVAREVFDVSGAGDTVIATFTLAIVAGASPYEAAILSNHAAGIVVGKLGTATARPDELLESFQKNPP
ncbi:MAG TPA: D-glycero-beta-D-manno-heptose-7-phosphate kinase [Candidatus Baltobacteraceae bacterium]|jgi:D-beta-D-heptose 7-phosphate kinase/D-beta-D-heptose 1-phosphate adenosyltransferase|nr:D-glycero-beta-D-manno-heptose-7-phosphate kinase [Candidatus Baltobacteraceae bacterium]